MGVASEVREDTDTGKKMHLFLCGENMNFSVFCFHWAIIKVSLLLFLKFKLNYQVNWQVEVIKLLRRTHFKTVITGCAVFCIV